MNKLLRIISVLMLLTFSQIGFASTSTDTVPATVTQKTVYYNYWTSGRPEAAGMLFSIGLAQLHISFPNMVVYSNTCSDGPFDTWASAACSSFSVNYGNWLQYISPVAKTENVYTCLDGYTLSGTNCTKTTTVDDTCAQLAAAGSSVLGSGYFISGSTSSLCVQANSTYKCAAANTGSSIFFTTVSDTCSYGTAAGSYFYYTGSDCDTVGPLSNNYANGTAAAAACPAPVNNTTSSATSTTGTTSGATSTASSATPTGCGTITNGDTTLTECSGNTSTGTTSSATSTTNSTDTTSTTNTTSSAGNTYTTNNNTTTNNNSSSSTVTNNYNYGASGANSTASGADSTVSTATTVAASYKDSITANDWSSRNYSTVLANHVSELKSSKIYTTSSTFFTVNFSGGNCQPWGGTFEMFGHSFNLHLDVCSFIAPYGVWMAAVVIFVCSFFAYRIAME